MTAPTLTDEPVAWMYEHDGVVYDDHEPPLLSINRYGESMRSEPWTETPLYRSPADRIASQQARIAKLVEWQRLAEAELENYRARIAELDAARAKDG